MALPIQSKHCIRVVITGRVTTPLGSRRIGDNNSRQSTTAACTPFAKNHGVWQRSRDKNSFGIMFIQHCQFSNP